MKVKAGRQVIDAIRLAYAADKPVLLEGKHGVGKSQLIEQAAAALNVACIVRDLSLMEPPDLVGLPRDVNGKTVYSPPSFLPESGKGLLCLEELNRSEKYMLSPCLELMTRRALQDFRLPKGWLPVGCINPSSDGYDVTELDPALLSRFVRIEVIPDVVEWLAWAEANGIHDAVIRHVKSTPDIFESDQSNPRSWAYVSDVVHAYEKCGDGHDDILGVAVSGISGDVHAAAFLRSYSHAEEPLSAEAIIGDYARYRKEVSKWVKAKRTDLLSASATNLMVALQSSDTASAISGDEQKQTNIGDFISDLPGDIGRQVKNAARRNGAVP